MAGGENSYMAEDLHHLIRDAYERHAHQHRDATGAFEHAVEIILQSVPTLSTEEARRQAAIMIATEPGAAVI